MEGNRGDADEEGQGEATTRVRASVIDFEIIQITVRLAST